MIPAADGGVSQQQVAASVDSNGSVLTLASIKAPKNGYVYIYISNQSNNDSLSRWIAGFILITYRQE